MKTGLHQGTHLRQELKINPRLYQAMDLLYMPLLDLQQHLKQELLNNPFLEMVELDDEEEAAEEGAEETVEEEGVDAKKDEDPIDWEEILLDGFESGVREEHEEKEYYEPVTVATRDLSDHLIDQIVLLDLSPREHVLAEEFIGNINEDGYLSCSLDEILDGVNEMIRRAAEEQEEEFDASP